MFHSQCLLSGKGPLGSIWVAAYFSKKLRKAQVTQTDISSSIDKILQDAFKIVTYRVLGYLLLGVVRIYSKKVEYLFDDCHKVLIRVNDFVVNTKENANTETSRAPYFSITLPDRFELDAFDLEILDDTSIGNVVPREEITLKDAVSENLAFGRYSLDLYCCEEIAASQSTCISNYNLVENILSSCLSNINMELGTSNNPNHSKVIMEKLQERRFSQEECMDLEMFYGVEFQNLVNPNTEVQADGEKIKDPKISASEDGMHGEASIEKFQDSRMAQEEGMDIEVFSGLEEHHSLVNPNAEVQADGEKIKDPEISASKDGMHGEASIEKFRDCRFSPEVCVDLEMFSRIEEPQNLVNPNAEVQADKEKMKDTEISVSEDGMHEEANKEKFQDCSSYQERFGGDHTEPYREDQKIFQEQMMVSELAPLENEIYHVVVEDYNPSNIQAEVDKLQDYMHASEECTGHGMFSCTKEPQEPVTPFDEENHDDGEQMFLEMKSSENRKYQMIMEDRLLFTALDGTPKSKVLDSSGASATTPQFVTIPTPATKERARISRKRKCVIDDTIVLPNEVIRKSIHDASDLISIRRKVPRTALAAWQACRNRDISRYFLEPLVPCFPLDLRSFLCEKKLKIIESAKTVGPPERLDIPEPLTVSVSEQMSIAPETPVRRSTLMKTFKSPGSPEALDFDGLRPEPFEIVEKEQSLCCDPQFDLNLCEEIDPCLEDNPTMYGWSGRTRIVARYLHRSFLNQKNERGKVLSMLPIVEGRTKKESARLFYEILVLKSKGYVDVKQDDSYSDILVWKLPKWGEICRGDDQ